MASFASFVAFRFLETLTCSLPFVSLVSCSSEAVTWLVYNISETCSSEGWRLALLVHLVIVLQSSFSGHSWAASLDSSAYSLVPSTVIRI